MFQVRFLGRLAIALWCAAVAGMVLRWRLPLQGLTPQHCGLRGGVLGSEARWCEGSALRLGT